MSILCLPKNPYVENRLSLWCWTSTSWIQKRLTMCREGCETSLWCGLDVCSEPSSMGCWRSGKSNPEWPPQGQAVPCLQRQELYPALVSVLVALSTSVLFFHMFKHILCTTVKHSEKSYLFRKKRKSLGASLGRGKKQDRQLAIQPSICKLPQAILLCPGKHMIFIAWTHH